MRIVWNENKLKVICHRYLEYDSPLESCIVLLILFLLHIINFFVSIIPVQHLVVVITKEADEGEDPSVGNTGNHHSSDRVPFHYS